MCHIIVSISDLLKVMQYFRLIFAVSVFCIVSGKQITEDDMEMKFNPLVDRVEALENTV